MKTPPGVTGMWIRKTTTESKLEIVDSFSSFTVWEHDTVPDVESINEGFDWFTVAASVS